MLIILLISFKLEGQYSFDFEIDSSAVEECPGSAWKQLPEQRWCCDTFQPIEGEASLHHVYDSDQDACDYLLLWLDPLKQGTPFSFSFRIRHTKAPSSQNNWQLALGATFYEGQQSGESVPEEGEAQIYQGLVLGVNFTGSDDLVKLWYVDKGETELLLSTTLNYQEEVGTDLAPLFLLSGDGHGGLNLYWSPDPSEQIAKWLGSCRIDELSWGRQVVVRYSYTSSRDMSLYLDQLILEGNFVKDSMAPELKGLEFLDEFCLELNFSEKVLISEASSFRLYSESEPGGVSPVVVRVTELGIVLSFPDIIPNRVPHQLRMEELADLDGNILRDTLVDVLRNEAVWGDLVFNEVMADPDPAIDYREEYLELINRSDFQLKLEGWWLQVNERSHYLEASNIELSDMELLPGELFLIEGITLPNEGAVLSLYSEEGVLIHATSYQVPWDGPHWKKEGGWSLESPDADQLCNISANWEYSNDPGGGSPGRVNSNHRSLTDMSRPVLLYPGMGERGTAADDSGEILLHFSEPLQLPRELMAEVHMNPGGIEPDSMLLLDPLREVLKLYFSEDFPSWPLYQLSVSGVCDCMGNISDDYVFRGEAVSEPEYASVLINEIMYDPEEGKPEYVELFLQGDGILDLQDLAIHLVEEGGSADDPIALSSHSRLVEPGQYLVLTECVRHLRDAYGLEVSGQWVEVEELPGLNNSSGSIYLSDRAGRVVDKADYSDEMHMELLGDPRGISLERVSAKRSGQDPDNWHSAASIADYATPGRENSQSYGGGGSDLVLDVSTEVFSPDNDAYEDLLEIYIRCNGNDWVIGLLITDLHGNIVRVLANNHLAAPAVTYTWDGEGAYGAMMPMGFYVLHARGYCPQTGEQWIRRRAVGLVYR